MLGRLRGCPFDGFAGAASRTTEQRCRRRRCRRGGPGGSGRGVSSRRRGARRQRGHAALVCLRPATAHGVAGGARRHRGHSRPARGARLLSRSGTPRIRAGDAGAQALDPARPQPLPDRARRARRRPDAAAAGSPSAPAAAARAHGGGGRSIAGRRGRHGAAGAPRPGGPGASVRLWLAQPGGGRRSPWPT